MSAKYQDVLIFQRAKSIRNHFFLTKYMMRTQLFTGLKSVMCALTGSFVFAGCHSKDPEPLTRTQLIVDKKWKVSTYFVTTSTGTQDLASLVPTCTQDDFEVFRAPNTFMYDEGSSKCDASSPQTQLGSWAFSTKDSQLTVTFGGNTRIYIVKELTSDKLNLTSSETRNTGGSVFYDITFAPVN